MRNPFSEIAQILDLRMSAQAARAVQGLPCELGTITATGLKLDGFRHEIRDYLVADWVVTVHLPAFSLIGTATAPVDDQGKPLPNAGTSSLTRYDFREAQIANVRLEVKPGLMPGDRVLAIPVNGGTDAVVLCKVVE